MPSESRFLRAGAFVRSVLPAEPAHWLILLGSTLLFISASLRWFPIPHNPLDLRRTVFTYLFSRLLMVAGATGLYLSLVPRKSQSGRFYLVFGPVAVMFAVAGCLGFAGLTRENPPSVIEQSTERLSGLSIDGVRSVVMNFQTGFWAALLGVALVIIFWMLNRTGRATLPVRLSSSGHAVSQGLEVVELDQRRTMRFVWAMISLVTLPSFVANMLVGLPYLVGFGEFARSYLPLLGQINEIGFSLCLLLLIVVAIGPGAGAFLRTCLKVPKTMYLGLGLLIPATLAVIWPLGVFAYDRIHWAATDFGSLDSPELRSYFAFALWPRLWMLIAALVEEFAWRGFLQPRFIRGYGIARGVFLLGVVWGAFHFSFDIRSGMTAGAVAIAVVRRLYMAISLSYVLAWLTIRSGSVLPAAVAHGVYNILLFVPVQPSSWLLFALWGACAWVLFRYFPVEVAAPDVNTDAGPTLEPAT